MNAGAVPIVSPQTANICAYKITIVTNSQDFME